MFELMRKREWCYLRSIGNSRDWQERKRYFSNSFLNSKEKFANSLILDYKKIWAIYFKVIRSETQIELWPKNLKTNKP